MSATSATRNILILDGHPDAASGRFVHALAEAYRNGAVAAKHDARIVRLADLDFPLLRSEADYEKAEPSDAVRQCQGLIEWAQHVVVLYPLWLGSMPALLKALLEQVFRPGFAFARSGRWPKKLLEGRSARIVVTMGMPAPIYKWFYRAHSLRSFKRNILEFVGFRRVRSTVIGGVATLSAAQRATWLKSLHDLGSEGA